jgi:hypothetical protein
MVQAKPDDQTRVQLLGQILAARLEADPGLAEELRELVGQADKAGDTVTIGGAHIQGNITGSTVNQAGRDQYQVRGTPR